MKKLFLIPLLFSLVSCGESRRIRNYEKDYPIIAIIEGQYNDIELRLYVIDGHEIIGRIGGFSTDFAYHSPNCKYCIPDTIIKH